MMNGAANDQQRHGREAPRALGPVASSLKLAGRWSAADSRAGQQPGDGKADRQRQERSATTAGDIACLTRNTGGINCSSRRRRRASQSLRNG